VAGGTGAEDILFKIDQKDYQVIKKRKPIFMGFSDFTFLLNDIHYHTRIPAIYFPTLRLGPGNFKKIASLLFDEPVTYHGMLWLTRPPKRRLSGVPLGGNPVHLCQLLKPQEPAQPTTGKDMFCFSRMSRLTSKTCTGCWPPSPAQSL